MTRKMFEWKRCKSHHSCGYLYVRWLWLFSAHISKREINLIRIENREGCGIFEIDIVLKGCVGRSIEIHFWPPTFRIPYQYLSVSAGKRYGGKFWLKFHKLPV